MVAELLCHPGDTATDAVRLTCIGPVPQLA